MLEELDLPQEESQKEVITLIKQKLVDKRLVITGRAPATNSATMELAHKAMIENWDQMKTWLEEDQRFLLWRARLWVALGKWRSHESSHTLCGDDLTEAMYWLKIRPDDLNLGETDFIKQSDNAKSKTQKQQEQTKENLEEMQRQLDTMKGELGNTQQERAQCTKALKAAQENLAKEQSEHKQTKKSLEETQRKLEDAQHKLGATEQDHNQCREELRAAQQDLVNEKNKPARQLMKERLKKALRWKQ